MTSEALTTDEIVQAGLCIGCGLCVGVVGSDRLRLVITPEGRERPVPVDRLSEREDALVNAICPGLQIHGMTEGDLGPNTETDLIWGPASEIFIGYAADPTVRFRGSTGGVLTALGQFLLDSRRVKFVLHVGPSRESPLRSERRLSFDAAQVLEGAGSRYGPAAALVDFEAILSRGEPFALIAKPCDVTAVNNLARHDARVRQLLRYRLALVCGGASDLTKSEELLAELGVDEGQLRLFRYRGYGNPGPTRIETDDGRAYEVSYQQLWEDESKWMIQPRCKVCPDAIGEAADIVASDTWPGGGPTGEDEGFNGVIVRTHRGRTLLQAALSAGAVIVERRIDFRELDIVQPHQVRKKRAVWARLAGMKAAGLPVPQTSRLRIESCARLNSLKENLTEARGARTRARLGRLGEPKPHPR
jgi:coenzyme F420 hydrogenase subunit beta